MSRLLPLIEPLESRYAPATLSISIDPSTIDEGTGGTKTFTFKVTLSEAPTEKITVGFFTQDGLAKIGDNDYVFKSGLLTFEPPASGQTADLEQEITVTVNSDTKFETDEDFKVVLHNAVGATLSNGQETLAATATIHNDDVIPTISIGNASISEGDIAVGGTGTPQKMKFTVSLSNASHEAVTVTLTTADGTALSGGDYVARLGDTLTFAPGETSKTFEVDINGDVVGETNETFTVALSNPQNGKLSETQKVATGTINNDDAILRVSDVRIAEGTPSANSGNTVQMIFTVTLDRAGKNDLVAVHYKTDGGTASPGSDYTSIEGDLSFQAGETSKTIIVEVNKDAIFENDETVFLNLTNATNAHIEDGQAVGTIGNDEIFASIKLNGENPLRKKENDFNEQVVFTVSLSSVPDAQFNPDGVDVEILLGGTATANQDYVVDGYTVVDGKITVHFNPGDALSKEVKLTVTKDNLASDDEVAQLSISGTKNATPQSNSSQASFTILNDDPKAYLIVDPVDPVAEAVNGKATVKVRLSAPVEGDVTFTYNTTSGTASAGSDFIATSGTGKIEAGSTSTTFDVQLVDDSLSEGNETFTFQVAGGTGGATASSINAKPSTIITITDPDTFPTIGFDSTDVVKIVEGDSGTKLVTFKLKLNTVSGQEVSVRAVGVNGTATSGDDFVFDQVIKVPAGQSETTFTVAVNGDQVDEIDENFFVQLSEPHGVTIDGDKDQAEVLILNNDRHISIGDITVSEGAGQATFKIKLNAASLHAISVKFKTSNGTAIGTDPAAANDDYVPVGDGFPAVVFAPGETEKEVTVNIVGDFTAEDAETFFGELFEPTNASIVVAKATATITNDDAAFRISDGRIVEGGPGATSMMAFVVKREGSASGIVKVDFATLNGTAVQGQDFTQQTGTLTFADGEFEKTILVPVLGDSTAEGESETFSIKLSNPTSGVALLDDTGVGTIVDDEAAVVTITDRQIVEGDDGTQKMIFIVTVTGSVNGTVRLNYATEAGTATTADFTTTTGTLNFTAAGSQSIEVPIIGDRVHEGDQEFLLKLTPASGSATVNMVDGTAVGTITDNDAAPKISAIGGKVVEGNSGQSLVHYTIKLDRPSDNTVTVDFSINGGTAQPGSDYDPIAPMKVTFLPGQTEVLVSLKVNGDTDIEPDETIVGVLANPTNATLAEIDPIKPANVATIQNDEIFATISNGHIAENSDSTAHGKLTINLSSASTETVKVSFVIADGTAIKGTDFDFVDGAQYTVVDNVITVAFAPGDTSKEIEFTMKDDTKFEGDETFTVKLTDAVNAAVGAASTGTFTIDENEQLTISVSDQFLYEGETTAPVIGTPTAPGKLGGPFQTPPPEPTVKNVQITVSLSGPSERPITVKASSLLDGDTSALDGVDFQAFTDTVVTFAPGETSKTITVGIIDDQADEQVETFKVKLTEAKIGTLDAPGIVGAPGTIRILDNDLRGLSINDATVVEGKNGTKDMTFTLTLSAAATQVITVNASTLASSAIGGIGLEGDFQSFSDQVFTFQPGETSKTVTVKINGDNIAEADESFTVELTNANGAIVTDARGEGRIVSDEIIYTLTQDRTTISETDNTKTVTFTVTRGIDPTATLPEGVSAASLLASAGSVTFATADDTAKAGSDYVAKNGVLQFAGSGPTDISKTVTVTINNDTAFEDSENFFFRLTGSTGGALVNAASVPQETLQSTITINSEDGAPTLSIGDVQKKTEGFSGTSTLVFTVTLSAANDKEDVTVNFATEDISANSLLGGANFQDYVAQMGTLTFAKGETSKTISVVINGDNRDEQLAEETFKVKLSDGSVAIAKGESIGTIVDDDDTPKLTFDGPNNGDISVTEGNDGTTTVTLKLKLSNASELPISVKASLILGTALKGTDYDGLAEQVVTFAAGETTAEVKFTVKGDALDELNETFQVSVAKDSTSQGAVEIQDSTATVTIVDDDPAPKLSINDFFIVEGNNGTSILTFTVTIDGTSDRPITVDFATLNGTAIAGSAVTGADYMARLGTLTFAPGDTHSQEIQITVFGDEFKEVDETFQVKLSNATNATIARDTGTGTIQQDGDTKVALSIKDVKIVEGNADSTGNTQNAVFIVELSAASDTDTTFTAFTLDGTAVNGVDYGAVNKTFTIPAGSTSVQIPVVIGKDSLFEATESFFVKVTDVSSNVEVFNGEGRGTIYNDDVQVVNAKTIRYVDVDGDLVTLRITKGSLFGANGNIYTLATNGSVGGQFLQSLDFTGSPGQFNGTSVYVTTEPQPGFFESGGVSNGKADVGFIFGANVDGNFIFSRGVDFTNIVIEGDLGGIQAGDSFVDPAIRGKIAVDSIGAKGTTYLPSGAPGNMAYFLSKVNAIKTTGDVNGFIQTFGGSFGDIGTLTIGGALQPLNNQQLGAVAFSGNLGKATIGKIVGGERAGSGSITASTADNTKIGSIRVLDAVVGGSGEQSGAIIARSIDFVSIGSNPTSEQSGIIGGVGKSSGLVFAPKIGKIVVGTSSDEAQIKGGTGVSSGRIGASVAGSITLFGDIVGGSESDSGQVGADSLGSLQIHGSIIGGSKTGAGSALTGSSVNSVLVSGGLTGGTAEKTGYLRIAGSVNSLTIGSSDAAGGIVGGSAASSGLVDVAGGIGKAIVYGDIKGGGGTTSGVLKAGSGIGSLTVQGDLIGGTATDSGQVAAAGLGTVRVMGSLLGGSAVSTGSIFSNGAGKVNSVTVAENITGGSGDRSGQVKIAGSLGSLTVGTTPTGDDGNVIGGGGTLSGTVEVAGSLQKAAIHGDLRGGNGASSGGLKIGGFINSLTIEGDLQGGGTSNTVQSGFITADRIARMTIQGDWLGGTGTGHVDSGAIRVSKDIGDLHVMGDVLGNASSRVVLAAAGTGSNHVAIGNLTIGGKTEYLDVLAGYGAGAAANNPLGNLINSDAVIKQVNLEGDVLATNVVAGIAPGPDGRFGTTDDLLGVAATNNPSLLASIAKVTIKGTVGETSEAYGIVAQYVKEVIVGGQPIALQKGPSNDMGAASKPIGGSEKFRVVEI